MVDQVVLSLLLGVGYHCLVGGTPTGVLPKGFSYQGHTRYAKTGLSPSPYHFLEELGTLVEREYGDVILHWAEDYARIRDDRFLAIQHGQKITALASLRRGRAYRKEKNTWNPVFIDDTGLFTTKRTENHVYATILEFPDPRYLSGKETTQYTIFLPYDSYNTLWNAFERGGNDDLLLRCYGTLFPQERNDNPTLFPRITKYIIISRKEQWPDALKLVSIHK